MKSNHNAENIAACLQQHLQQREMSVYQLSQQTGISRDYLSRLFNSKIKKPGIDKLQKIATALNLELNDLLPCPPRLVKQASDINLCELGYYPGTLPLPHNPCLGRQQDLSTLQASIQSPQIALIGLWGLAGIGKTSLAIELAQLTKVQFDQVLWLDAIHPHTQKTLQNGIWPDTLLQGMRSHPLLIVIDHLEVLKPQTTQALSTPTLFNPLLNTLGRSKLILISRVKPQWLTLIEKQMPSAQLFKVTGLQSGTEQLLQNQGLGESEYWPELIQLYRGHPLALKLAAATIQTVFAGSVRTFLEHGTLFLGDLSHLLQMQVQHCSDPERQILETLSQATEPLFFCSILEALDQEWRKSQIIEALDNLISQSLVDPLNFNHQVCYSLQPFIRQVLRHPLGLSLEP
ncbi:MAG: helix-turn-helix domain-containing protein [Thermosynechococcaceae cyanobacterium]